MSFNNSKFKEIISRKKSQHVASALSLGGQVSADLSWSYHIKCICTEARKIMGSSFTQFSVQAMWIALWKDFTHHLWDLILNKNLLKDFLQKS